MRTEKGLTLFVVVAPFIGTIYAIYTLWMRWVTPLDVGLLVVGTLLCGLGITIGYHRLATHQAFKAHPIVRAFWYMVGSMGVEGPVIEWAQKHDEHHRYSDKPGDPHSPLEGFWHAHIGWMLGSYRAKPEYAQHLNSDPVAKWFSKTFLAWVVISLLVPFTIGYVVGGSMKAAWMAFIWGGLVRVFYVHHVTWSINSMCHLFGSREFETSDQSRNNPIFGWLAFGEGWHNNHHAFPNAAIQGFKWWQFDLSGIIIRLMETYCLVWDVVWISPDRQEDRRAHLASRAAARQSDS
jgi:stearoyl-CoA desaturase (delta-9 desaturase)